MSKISILMPVKNTERFLEECLDSIIEQDEKNWELIAVDDGSTDGSFDLLCAYATKDDSIKVFKNEGQGIIHALRTAYKNSSGDYITRMDSDDRMTPNKLGLLKSHLAEKGRGYIATGLVAYFSEGEMGGGYLKYQNWLNALTKNENNFSAIYKECVIPSPCWMINRADLDKSGAFEPDTYPEDYDLVFRWYEQGFQVVGIQEVLHYWRDYSTRTSRTDEHYADVSFFDLKIHYFKKLEKWQDKSLLLWGAGRKGKKVAKLLQTQQMPFEWLCDNPKKIGLDIYGKIMKPTDFLKQSTNACVLVVVSGPEEQATIVNELNALGLKAKEDYFLLC